MKITVDMVGFGSLLAVKDGKPIGLCREIDTDTKIAKQLIYELDPTRLEPIFTADGTPSEHLSPRVIGPFDKDGNFVECYRFILFDELYYDPEETPEWARAQLPSWVQPHQSGTPLP